MGGFLRCMGRSLVPLHLFAASVSGEEVVVFASKDELVRIPPATLYPVPKLDENRVSLLVYSLGKELGKIETGEIDLAGMAKKAAAHDQSDDPFFGPGFEFILRDGKGKYYILFFEYEKDHKTFRGIRAALAPLNDLGSKAAVFVGDPYQGAIFDQEVLKQLKTIAENLPAVKEPAGGEKRGE